MEIYFTKFLELVVMPFRNLDAVWGILPVYTSLIVGELYRERISYAHAVGNGFVMLWAGADWARHLLQHGKPSFLALSWLVTLACIGIGVLSIAVGLRRTAKWLCEILGHTRFSSYFIIMVYPMQAQLLPWSATYVASILIFMLPVWLMIYALGRLITRVVK